MSNVRDITYYDLCDYCNYIGQKHNSIYHLIDEIYDNIYELADQNTTRDDTRETYYNMILEELIDWINKDEDVKTTILLSLDLYNNINIEKHNSVLLHVRNYLSIILSNHNKDGEDDIKIDNMVTIINKNLEINKQKRDEFINIVIRLFDYYSNEKEYISIVSCTCFSLSRYMYLYKRDTPMIDENKEVLNTIFNMNKHEEFIDYLQHIGLPLCLEIGTSKDNVFLIRVK